MDKSGYQLYSESIRRIDDDTVLFTAKRNSQKFVGVAGNQASVGMSNPVDTFIGKLESEACVAMYALTWENSSNWLRYGALLDAKRNEIIETLKANEADHYGFVSGHINRHLLLLFGS